MLRIPRSLNNNLVKQALSLGITGGQIFSVPRSISKVVFNPDGWKFSLTSHYNPHVISYKPPEFSSNSERILSIMVRSLCPSAESIFVWGDGDCMYGIQAQKRGTTPRIQREGCAEAMVSVYNICFSFFVQFFLFFFCCFLVFRTCCYL